MNNSRAIALMVCAMALFAGVDAFIKLASRSQSVAQIIALTSLGMLLVFFVLMRRAGEPFFSRSALHPALLLRTLGEVFGASSIVMALSLAPLSSVVAIAQAQPLVVTLGAALFLKEAVGWRRWLAIGVGFVGVLIVVRPGFGLVETGLLWAVHSVLWLAVRDLASRALPADVTTSFAVGWSMVPMIVLGVLVVPLQGGWQPVTLVGGIWLIGIVLAASGALWTLTSSMRVGEVSAVAPFRYTRIVFAMVIAYVVFNEKPDLLTWLGVGLIVGSGLYSFLRERRWAKEVD